MSVSTGTSFILSLMSSIVLFCGMQIYRHWLASSAIQTIFGGYLSSMLFVLILTFNMLTARRIFQVFAQGANMNFSLCDAYYVEILFAANKAVGNLEAAVFGKTFQTKLFPEVFMCLLLAVSAASLIHRVCITTCILFSIASLYYMNKLSQVVYAAPVVVPSVQGKKKKGN